MRMVFLGGNPYAGYTVATDRHNPVPRTPGEKYGLKPVARPPSHRSLPSPAKLQAPDADTRGYPGAHDDDPVTG